MAEEVFELPKDAISKVSLIGSDGAAIEVDLSKLTGVRITSFVSGVNDTTANAEDETMAEKEIDVEKLRAEILGEVAKTLEVLKADAAAKAVETEKLKAEKAKLEKEVEELNKAGPRGSTAGASAGWEALSRKDKVEVLRKNLNKGELLVLGAKKLGAALRGEWSAEGRTV